MKECDLVMKGGTTSGVVYPLAVDEISKKFRLRNIGGTSAGAIAASVAAAAEFQRQTNPNQQDHKGFQLVRDLPVELGTRMRTLFQPAPELKALFAIFIRVIETNADPLQVVKVAATVGRAYALWGLSAALLGLIIYLSGMATPATSVVATLLCAIVLTAYAFWRDVSIKLPRNGFGLCPGTRQPGFKDPGLSCWLADKIDEVAGVADAGRPLTIGQLATQKIQLAAMTTDLSSGRPFQLPLKTAHYWFSESEFRRILPERVVAYLKRFDGPLQDTPDHLPKDLYKLPSGDDFPVILLARMSLSFPGLLSAVGLYRHDDMIETQNKHDNLRRCLFSDGGLSSNFPIHFFDTLLPTRPTFGISLASWKENYHGKVRVALVNDTQRQTTHLPVTEVGSLSAFGGAVLDTARNWQDRLQTLLPGHAHRIIEVRLDDSTEGGLNLNMPTQAILRLAAYGKQAGAQLVDTEVFSFDEHRWLRGLTTMSKLEAALVDLADSYDRKEDGELSYPDILETYPAKSYGNNSSVWRRSVLKKFADDLAAIGRDLKLGLDTNEGIKDGNVPVADGNVRIVASSDRIPRN